MLEHTTWATFSDITNGQYETLADFVTFVLLPHDGEYDIPRIVARYRQLVTEYLPDDLAMLGSDVVGPADSPWRTANYLAVIHAAMSRVDVVEIAKAHMGPRPNAVNHIDDRADADLYQCPCGCYTFRVWLTDDSVHQWCTSCGQFTNTLFKISRVTDYPATK